MFYCIVWIQQLVTGEMALLAGRDSERALQVAVKSTQQEELHVESVFFSHQKELLTSQGSVRDQLVISRTPLCVLGGLSRAGD